MAGRSLLVAAAAATFALTSGPLQAQEAKIEPMEAKQCSLWASYMSAQIEDESTVRALLFATNYFTGYYEGATGRAIGDDKELAPILEVEADLERFTQLCAAHKGGFGERMGAWGDFLGTLDDRLEEGAQ